MMKKILYFAVAATFAQACNIQPEVANAQTTASTEDIATDATKQEDMKSLHDFTSKTLDGGTFDFSELEGKRVLIVNTASECGYTPQYEGLQELYEKYGGKNFTIIGFPSNDFGGQEPGSNEEIKEFCKKNYGVNFPMMDKTPVTGDEKHSVYQWLTDKERNGRKDVKVQWNFNKFLVNEKGEWYAYFPSDVKPMDERIVEFAKGELAE